ncbi:hypothetical protein M378DRAFT_300188 [Amanita muscaria Koide BX008]|uniref:Uncharacterized protein n=1 Tax=Amanita muscaria (strain Koide BX008) TaxID=946122 RepID=A0A0C2SV36_AMAMK|nr:hypothetical protein M378DRAFT_300188 [Amanita muscaria Koide BX008]
MLCIQHAGSFSHDPNISTVRCNEKKGATRLLTVTNSVCLWLSCLARRSANMGYLLPQGSRDSPLLWLAPACSCSCSSCLCFAEKSMRTQ